MTKQCKWRESLLDYVTTCGKTVNGFIKGLDTFVYCPFCGKRITRS